MRGNFPQRNFGGHAYHGRLAWGGGRWRHEMHNGRMGWWWDVGGAWYFYPQPMEGPPTYVSDVEVMDDVAGPDDGGPDGPGPGPGPGYPPPVAAYAPPPPPPPPDPAASAVGGVWYFYPQPMEGPPTYVSDVEVMDDVAGPDDGMPPGPGPGPGYPPPPVAAYAPPPPPPAPDPAASAVGGAIVGGVLGGLITGRPVGAAVGAITGGTIGAIAGAQAAARPGYYLAQGNCYYKYPSGQYVQVDPRSCY